jgi:hypothetical protein
MFVPHRSSIPALISARGLQILLSALVSFTAAALAGAETADDLSASSGEDAAASIQNNPYFVTLLQIGLTKEQVPDFQARIAKYAGDRQAAIERELRSHQANLRSRINRSRSKLEKRFLADMQKLLDADQFSRFPPFNAELDKMLLERESLEQDNDENLIFPNN